MIRDFAKNGIMGRDGNAPRLNEERIRDLASRLGYESVRQIEMAAQAPKNHLKKYMNGKGNPGAAVLLRLSELLGAPPSYLYGRPMDVTRRNVIEMVRRVFGPDEASVLEIYVDMTEDQKRTLLQMLSAFAKQDIPPSAYQREAREAAAKRGPEVKK